jgi:hypothetical protein
MELLGFDRPLRPEWIYELLKILEVGKKPNEYYAYYDENICNQLVGKHGKRKTRTILLRTFLYNFQDTKSVIHDNFILQLSRQHDLEYLKPIYIAKLLIDYNILRYLSGQTNRLFDSSQTITSKILTQKMVDKFGDLEIIKRSTRSFLKTLSDFGILQPISPTEFQQLPKLMLSNEQVKDILLLYALSYNTEQVDVVNFDTSIFTFYHIPNLNEVAKTFHSKNWEYIRGVERGFLMLR